MGSTGKSVKENFSPYGKTIGAEWLDFSGSYGENFDINVNTQERAYEWIELLKSAGVINKDADTKEVHDYMIHYGDYDISDYKNAPYGKLIEGFVRYEQGATRRGYDNNKKGLDAEYGLSKFIDTNKEIQLTTNIPMYRGVRTSEKEIELLEMAYKGKSPISMKGISSWTANEYMADRFTKGTLDATGDIRLVYKDVTKGTRPAIPFPHGGQKEAIYSSSARFEILGIRKTSWGYEIDVKKK